MEVTFDLKRQFLYRNSAGFLCQEGNTWMDNLKTRQGHKVEGTFDLKGESIFSLKFTFLWHHPLGNACCNLKKYQIVVIRSNNLDLILVNLDLMQNIFCQCPKCHLMSGWDSPLVSIKLLESPIPTAAAAPSQKAHFALCIAPSVVA